MTNLSVNYLGIPMKTPLIGASGTVGFGLEIAEYVDMNKVGAISGKGLAPTPWKGNEGIRVAETDSGMLNAIGLENPGVPYFIEHYLPKVKKLGVPFIANMVGKTTEEYAECAKMLTVDGVDALEVNISCPNVKQGGLAFGTDCAMASGVVEAVKACTKKPVIVKLSPNVTDIAQMAQAVEAAGADAISLINTLTGMAIDIHTWKPKLGNGVGGLSGPAVKPVAVRMVYQVAKAVKVPIIGMGGIMTADDAAEFLLAGATAVAVGTAQFVNPTAALEVVQGLETYVQQRGLENVQQMIGQVRF